jgi:hypothetical protein
MAINLRGNINQSSIGESYNKMISQNDPYIAKFTGYLPKANQFAGQPGQGGFYDSISGLEAASMRLANAASQRSMAESGYGSLLKRGETAEEYGLKGGLMDQEYGLKGGLMSQEYGLKDASTAKEYGLKSGLAGMALQQSANLGGYTSPQEMFIDARRRRRTRF